MHPLLERQIKRCLGGAEGPSAAWNDFFAAVGDAYSQADADRRLIEHSLEEMSKELTERNRDLRGELEARRATETALLAEKAEQAALIRKLEEAHNQLLQSEKLASIGQLAAGVAHEINNPVGFVNSNLGTLAESRDGLARVKGIVQDLKDFSRVEVESEVGVGTTFKLILPVSATTGRMANASSAEDGLR
ncbi:MAG: histidine kinase dimerization/phospho-acceptor domain-containing protein [Rhodocyclaceae bacterium]|nr:histidine kinase dimerization/phospho-acceptor domain-containing protein [Rhodocyclaceae bacterium]